jgi:cobalt-zinc-cadmium resistance protein CzcA
MKNAANLQYSTGEINYLIWANLIQNAIAIESEYVDAVHEMNRTIIQLNYLTAK